MLVQRRNCPCKLEVPPIRDQRYFFVFLRSSISFKCLYTSTTVAQCSSHHKDLWRWRDRTLARIEFTIRSRSRPFFFENRGAREEIYSTVDSFQLKCSTTPFLQSHQPRKLLRAPKIRSRWWRFKADLLGLTDVAAVQVMWCYRRVFSMTGCRPAGFRDWCGSCICQIVRGFCRRSTPTVKLQQSD